jgi:hypothetical protein
MQRLPTLLLDVRVLFARGRFDQLPAVAGPEDEHQRLRRDGILAEEPVLLHHRVRVRQHRAAVAGRYRLEWRPEQGLCLAIVVSPSLSCATADVSTARPTFVVVLQPASASTEPSTAPLIPPCMARTPCPAAIGRSGY